MESWKLFNFEFDMLLLIICSSKMQMQSYMKIAEKIGRTSDRTSDDKYKDGMAKQFGHLSTDPWHPHIVSKSVKY